MTTRRDLLLGSAAATLAGCASPSTAAVPALTAAKTSTNGIAKRALGKTGASVSMLALGGYHLGTVKDEATAVRIVHEAIDQGFDPKVRFPLKVD